MQLLWQWIVVALIGIAALWMIARHLGLGQKKAGCAGCNICAKPQRADSTARRRQLH